MSYTYQSAFDKYDMSEFVERHHDELTSTNGMSSESIQLQLKNEFAKDLSTNLIGRIFGSFCEKSKIGSKHFYKLNLPEPVVEETKELTDYGYLKQKLHVVSEINKDSEDYDVCVTLTYEFIRSRFFKSILENVYFDRWQNKIFDKLMDIQTVDEDGKKIKETNQKSFYESFMNKHGITRYISDEYIQVIIKLVLLTLDHRYEWSTKSKEQKALRAKEAEQIRINTEIKRKQAEREHEEFIEIRKQEADEYRKKLEQQKLKVVADKLNMSITEYKEWYDSHKSRFQPNAWTHYDPDDYYHRIHMFDNYPSLRKVNESVLQWIIEELEATEPSSTYIKKFKAELQRRDDERQAKLDKERKRIEEANADYERRWKEASEKYVEFCNEHNGKYLRMNNWKEYRKMWFDPKKKLMWYSIDLNDEKNQKKAMYIGKSTDIRFLHGDFDFLTAYETVNRSSNDWRDSLAQTEKTEEQKEIEASPEAAFGRIAIQAMMQAMQPQMMQMFNKQMKQMNKKLKQKIQDKLDDGVEGLEEVIEKIEIDDED